MVEGIEKKSLRSWKATIEDFYVQKKSCEGRSRTFKGRLVAAETGFIPNSLPPRQEGMAANFITSHCCNRPKSKIDF